MARPKKPTAELRSIEECGTAMHELLVVTVQREALQADRDLAVATAQKQYEGSIDAATRRVQDLQAQLQQYYMTHLQEIEKDGKRSIQLVNGVMGRRKSPPALKPKNKSFTWASIRVLLRAAFGSRFFHEPKEPEIDKDLIKRELPEAELGNYGLKLEQEEEFYAEPARLPKAEGE